MLPASMDVLSVGNIEVRLRVGKENQWLLAMFVASTMVEVGLRIEWHCEYHSCIKVP